MSNDFNLDDFWAKFGYTLESFSIQKDFIEVKDKCLYYAGIFLCPIHFGYEFYYFCLRAFSFGYTTGSFDINLKQEV